MIFLPIYTFLPFLFFFVLLGQCKPLIIVLVQIERPSEPKSSCLSWFNSSVCHIIETTQERRGFSLGLILCELKKNRAKKTLRQTENPDCPRSKQLMFKHLPLLKGCRIRLPMWACCSSVGIPRSLCWMNNQVPVWLPALVLITKGLYHWRMTKKTNGPNYGGW